MSFILICAQVPHLNFLALQQSASSGFNFSKFQNDIQSPVGFVLS